MNDADFIRLAEATFSAIARAVDEAIDEAAAPLDYEYDNGVLTLAKGRN